MYDSYGHMYSFDNLMRSHMCEGRGEVFFEALPLPKGKGMGRVD